MLRYLLSRFFMCAAALLLLAFQTADSSRGGGNNGMGFKLGLFVALVALLINGLYLFGEMCYYCYKSNYQIAAINLGLLALGAIGFLYLAAN